MINNKSGQRVIFLIHCIRCSLANHQLNIIANGETKATLVIDGDTVL